MKIEWNHWDFGGKTIFLSVIGAILSQFLAWVDIGIASQNGFEQGAFLMLVFYAYPVWKLLRGGAFIRWLSVILSVLSIISVVAYLDD